MRKFYTFALLIVLFGLFSGPALAGKIEECEAIKHDPAYKGLYGLCNAYWNADEEDREDILRNFEKKAGPGGPGMPGLPTEPVPTTDELVCPCWPEGQIDIGAVPDPMGCQVAATFAFASYDGGAVQYNIDSTVGNACFYMSQLTGEQIFRPGFFGEPAPTNEEMFVCEQELLLRIAEDFQGECL